MKKKHLCYILTAVAMVGVFAPVQAKIVKRSCKDSDWYKGTVSPTEYISTSYRTKEDKTSHYIYNNRSLILRVKSKVNPSTNTTYKFDSVIVPNGQYCIKNLVREMGYKDCYLNVRAKSETGYTVFMWSPDTCGSYPSVN